MRKEIIIAVVVGLSLGLIVVFGLRTAKESLTNRAQPHPTPFQNVSTATNSGNHQLLINSPQPDEIIPDSQTTIVGTTTPESMVSIVSDNTVATTVADDTGAFTVNFSLKPGPNAIVVTSYNQIGEAASATFTVVFSSADLDDAIPATKTASTKGQK